MKNAQPRSMASRVGAAGFCVLGLALVVTAARRGPAAFQATPTSPTFDPRKTYSPEVLRSDLQVLWDILEEGHGGFERYVPAASQRQAFDAVRDGLKAPLTQLEFYARVLPLVAGIKDGHTRLDLSPRSDAWLDSRPIIFPLGLRFLGDKAYVLRDFTPDRGVGEGAEILSIEGQPVRSLLEALLPLVSADAGIRTFRVRRLEHPVTLSRLFGLRFGSRESFRISYRPSEAGETRVIVVSGLKASDFARLLNERYPATAGRRPDYELTFAGTIAVLTVRQFADDPDETRPGYPDFLTASFQELEAKGTSALVIDLRGNGGGRDEYAKFLFAHVMDRPFLYYWALETKKDRYDLFRYTDEPAGSADELARPLSRNARGWFDVLGHPNRGLQSTRKPHFAGRVAILIDGGSFSATGETTSAFHYHKKAVFFGEECGAGYYGNTSGFMVTAILPATRLRVRVPLVLYTMAVDGYPKDRGLVPDFPVTPTIEDLLAGRDVAMERALAYLRR